MYCGHSMPGSGTPACREAGRRRESLANYAQDVCVFRLIVVVGRFAAPRRARRCCRPLGRVRFRSGACPMLPEPCWTARRHGAACLHSMECCRSTPHLCAHASVRASADDPDARVRVHTPDCCPKTRGSYALYKSPLGKTMHDRTCADCAAHPPHSSAVITPCSLASVSRLRLNFPLALHLCRQMHACTPTPAMQVMVQLVPGYHISIVFFFADYGAVGSWVPHLHCAHSLRQL